jgi:hypothetical protein
MSAAEFHFTGYGYMVRCPFCKVLMGYWKSGDNPFFENKHRSPNCDFASGHISTDPDTPITYNRGYVPRKTSFISEKSADAST